MAPDGVRHAATFAAAVVGLLVDLGEGNAFVGSVAVTAALGVSGPSAARGEMVAMVEAQKAQRSGAQRQLVQFKG